MKIRVSNLSQSFPISGGKELPVFSGLDLTMESGCFTVILGESGCGKSTLLNLLAGLIMPTCGAILANGTAVAGPSPDRSILFQQPSLLPWLTVAENIAFGCRLRGETDGLQGRIDELLAMIGLKGFEDHHPAELSVGMAQRVCLARALIGRPNALLLDEPFGGLDICHRTHLQNELIKIWQHDRFTAVLVTHDVDEALVVGEKVIVLGGRPASIVSVHDVTLPYPRDIASQPFFELRSQILVQLRAATSVTNSSPQIRP